MKLHRTMARNLALPIPPAPETIAERIKAEVDEAEVSDLFTTLYKANPTLFGKQRN